MTFGDFGDGKAGSAEPDDHDQPGIFSNNNKPVPLNGQRKYRVVVKAKGVSGAMSLLIRRQNKIGQTDSTYEDKTVTLTTDWQTITGNRIDGCRRGRAELQTLFSSDKR